MDVGTDCGDAFRWALNVACGVALGAYEEVVESGRCPAPAVEA